MHLRLVNGDGGDDNESSPVVVEDGSNHEDENGEWEYQIRVVLSILLGKSLYLD